MQQVKLILDFRSAFAFVFVKDNLAQPQRPGCYFEVFILSDVLHGLLKGKFNGRDDENLLIRSGCAHIGQLLGFGHIYHQIIGTDMFTDYLTGINIFVGMYKESAPVLKFINGVSYGLPGFP